MTSPHPSMDLSGNRRRRNRERVVRASFFAAGLISILISVAIVLTLVGEAWTFISGLAEQGELGSLWSLGWFPRRGFYDLRTIVAGTFIIALIGIIVATPLGLGSAIYLAEYATPRTRRRLKPLIEILAGIPSVVLGFWALAFIGPEVVQRVFQSAGVFSMLSAGLAVGVLITPLVASVSEDAMRAVPASLREASYGLGANRVTTTLRVVLPAAISGIAASLILAFSRAIGETMIVFMAAGAVGGALFTMNPLDPGQTMTAAIASLAIGTDQVAGEGLAFQSLFFVGLLLFLMTLALNAASNRLVRRFREVY
ncbi:MAG: phosphate ABC transporter permease subunit PstC [Acidimicrobiia bacterium]|nr:phosphate ABC transporter permease subunit PstC [Acidimicrobiia bacterium]